MAAGVNPAAPMPNPFPGLRPFKTEESTLFFGRDDQIGEALDRMLRKRMLAVVGVSGCGKSSLVSAGMVPALEMGLAGDPEQHWRVVSMRPGDGPLRELSRCLGFGGALAERTYGLQEAVETNLPAGHNLLLVIDQFEEIFPFRDRKLREGAGSEADLFVSYLLRAAQDSAGRVYVVLTMRSDYLGECAKFHGLPEALNDGQYLVPRMTRQQLQEAIEGPLEAAAVKMHPGLVQELLNQCDEEPDNLPLLQHLLRRVFEQWELEGAQGIITSDIAGEVGGLAGALNQDAEKICDELSPEQMRVAEILFRRITESRQADREQDDRPVRRPQTVVDLACLARVDETELLGVASQFEQRGLLVLRKTDQGDKIDLPHECLCLRWTRLKGWIRAEAEDAKKLRFFWDATERKAPLAGLALSEALEWRRDGRLDPACCSRYLSTDQIAALSAWVAESESIVGEATERERRREEENRAIAEERLARKAEERRNQRVRMATLVLGLLAIALLFLGTWALKQSALAKDAADRAQEESKRATGFAEQASKASKAAVQNAIEAKASEKKAIEATAHAIASENKARAAADLYLALQFASQSDSVFHKDPANLDRAVLLGIESIRWRPSPEGDTSLRESLKLVPKTIRTWKHNVAKLVAFSSDGRLVATEDELIDAATGKQVARRNAGDALALALSPDGKFLATDRADSTIRVTETATGREIAQLRHDYTVRILAFSADGKRLAIACGDHTLRVMFVATGQVGWSSPYESKANALAFSPDGELLAVGNDDRTARIIRMSSGVWGLPLQHRGAVRAIAFSPDGKWLATGSDDATLRMFATTTGRAGSYLPHQSAVRAVAFSPNGAWLATGSADNTARVMETSTGKEVSLSVHGTEVRAVAFTRDSTALQAWDDIETRVTEVQMTRQSIRLQNGPQSDTEANALVFSPDGKFVLVGSVDSISRVMDSQTGKVVEATPVYPAEVYSVAFSPDGKAIWSWLKDGSARMMDLARKRETPERQVSRTVYATAFSSDGRLLAAGGEDKTVAITAFPSGQTLATVHVASPVYAVVFSPDGKSLATGDDNTARLWDWAADRELMKVDHPNRVYALGFSADGEWLASGGGNSAIVTELSNGRERYRFEIDRGLFGCVHFSRDRRWLETVHQVSDSDHALLYSRHPLDTTEDLIKEACQKLTRNLTQVEWNHYARGFPYRRSCENLPYPSK